MSTPFGADGSSIDVRKIWEDAAAVSALERGPSVMRRIVTVDYVTNVEFGGDVSMAGSSVTVLVSPTDPRGFRYRTVVVVDGLNHRTVAEQEVIAAIERRAVQFGARSCRVISTMTEEVM